jgi:ABC-type bacteriocin/lantibiotic exporter with double-glycine peptidase domain
MKGSNSKRATIFLKTKSWQESLHKGRCGPASLKIVASYYGIRKSEIALTRLCNVDPILGTSSAKLCHAARRVGFSARTSNFSNFDEIERLLSNGTPIIVNWFSPGRIDRSSSEMADGHYSVVSGISPSSITIEDPELGKRRRIKRSDFLRVWFDFKGENITRWNDLIVRQIIVIKPRG